MHTAYRVFDIEIAKTIEQTEGGWTGAREGKSGHSCTAVYDSEEDSTRLFGPNQVEALADYLEGPHVIVSFNGIGFDQPAIEGMLGRKLQIREHCDLLQILRQTTGSWKGLKLDDLAHATLGRRKSDHGAHAPVIYQEALALMAAGQYEEALARFVNLLNYCSLDVILTRDLLRFLQKNGFVVGPNGPVHPTLPPYFGTLGGS